MTIDLVFPVLPPTLDGIGDHTACLARALSARKCRVRVHTAQRDWTPLAGTEVHRTFHLDNRRGILNLTDKVQADPPDWLLLQFEQFSYGHWGLNPFVPLAIRRLRHGAPDMQTAVMFHEDFMPASGFRSAMMSIWQRSQFWGLGQLADVAFFSTEPRTNKYRKWFSGTDVRHLPVGSNIPDVKANYLQERKRLGIDTDTLVLGLFGSAHPSRLLSHVNAAVSACARALPNCLVLYAGPDGDQVREALNAHVPLLDAGPLPPEEVSRRFAAMDLYLAPFESGVSTRRGSFLVGLQHGVPTVSTKGPETGKCLRSRDRTAFTLTPWSNSNAFATTVVDLVRSPRRRRRMRYAAQDVFTSNFGWSEISQKLLRTLTRAKDPSNASP